MGTTLRLKRSIEFWAYPIWDRDKALRWFSEAFHDLRHGQPTAKIHVLLETGDRYRALRSKLAKRAAEEKKPVKPGPKKKSKVKRVFRGPTCAYTRSQCRRCFEVPEEKVAYTYLHLHQKLFSFRNLPPFFTFFLSFE